MDIGCEGHRLSGEDGEGLDWGPLRMYWPGRFSLKDRNRLRVFSRSLSTHSFLLCSSSLFFSRFCRQQRETPRGTGEKQRLSFAAPSTRLTYQVDLMMLVEDYGALFCRQVLLLMCIRALILFVTQVSSAGTDVAPLGFQGL